MNQPVTVNSRLKYAAFIAGCLCALENSPADAQILTNAHIHSVSATSGAVFVNGYFYNGVQYPPIVINSYPTGFNFAGHVFWENPLTLGSTLTLVVRANLDPAYPGNPNMQLGASMSGSFDVPGSHAISPPDFVVNNFSLTTDIPGGPYPQAVAQVNGPFHGGQNGQMNIMYAASNATAPFQYGFLPALPFIDLTFTMNADGLTVPGVIRIDFPATARFQIVPEPSTFACIVAAGWGLLLIKRRRGC